MIDRALMSLRPGAQWAILGDEYEGIQWMDETQTMPSKKEVLAEVERLKLEQQRLEYQRLRAKEYPSIGDQLDALFRAGAFPPDMADKIQAVKDKFPKS